MNSEEANKEVASRFKYVTDKVKYGFFETWSVMDLSEEVLTGDCEDYSLTVLWLISEKKLGTFLYNVLLNPKCGMHYVRFKSTWEGHAVLSHNGKFCDNIHRKWFSKADLPYYDQYEWKWRIPGPIIVINLLLGKIIKRVL
jgi:predicted transglutaminase-like cysteine proteinase